MDYKPCPFCGSKEVSLERFYGKYGWFVQCSCEFCGARTRTYRNPLDADDPRFWEHESCDRAIIAWNQRAGGERDA